MNEFRILQISEALKWAALDTEKRIVSMKKEAGQSGETLWIAKFVGFRCYGAHLEEKDGIDMDEILQKAERKRDEEELITLQKKLGG